MRKQSEGLTKEYDRLLEEHAKLQVSTLSSLCWNRAPRTLRRCRAGLPLA